jgi:hypothetical protein
MFDCLYYIRVALNVVFKWLALLLHIVEVLGSNISPEAGNCEVCFGYLQSLQGTAGTLP